MTAAPATAPAGRRALLDGLAASGLLTPAQAAKAERAVPAGATAPQAAHALVAAGFLTKFQADRVLAGRTDGFVLGPYVIQDAVGGGSVGRVFKAKHRTMNRAVAIKVLAPDVTRSDAARSTFHLGVRAAAKLRHPNVVTTYDANEVGERLYVVTEFVDGPTLQTLVERRGPLPAAEACEYARQAARGLAHAHEMGLVHRDVKPGNLLVARPGHGGAAAVKVADFGLALLSPLARVRPTDATPPPPAVRPDAAAWLSTLDYSAPEQIYSPDAADHRADLYSLGAVFYFLLTGRPPFAGGTPHDRACRHLWSEPTPVHALRPDLPPAVAGIVHALLAKDPNARPPSAADVADRMEEYALGGATRAGHPSAVSFDLSPTPAGSTGHSGGYLTGLADADSSPWDEIASSGDHAVETLAAGPHTGRLPTFTPAGTKPHPRHRGPGVSPLTLIGYGSAVLLTCLLVIGLLMRLVAR